MTTNVPLPSTPDVDVHERRAWTMPAPVACWESSRPPD